MSMVFREAPFSCFDKSARCSFFKALSGQKKEHDGNERFSTYTSCIPISNVKNKSLISWRYKKCEVDFLETSINEDLTNAMARLILPAPILCKNAIEAFYDEVKEELSICIVTSVGTVHRIVLKQVDTFIDLSYDSKSASILSPLLTKGGRSELINSEALPGTVYFEINDIEYAEICHWKDRDTLLVGTSSSHLIVVSLPQENENKSSTVRYIPNLKSSSIPRLIYQAFLGSTSVPSVLAISSANFETESIAITLGADWHIRVWSTVLSTCLSTIDVRNLLGLNAAQLASGETRLGMWDSSSGTSLTRVWFDSEDNRIGYFIVSLHCRGSITGYPRHFLVSLRSSDSRLMVHNELLGPLLGAELISVAIDPPSNAIWGLWSSSVLDQVPFNCLKSSIVYEYSLASMRDEVLQEGDIVHPVVEHQCLDSWREFEVCGDSALREYVDRLGGWDIAVTEEFAGVPIGLRGLQYWIEKFYFSRIALKDRFGLVTLNKALDAIECDKDAHSDVESTQLDKILLTMRTKLSGPIQLIRAALDRGEETQLTDSTQDALQMISDAWSEFIASCVKLSIDSCAPVQIVALPPTLRGFGGGPMLARANGMGIFLPSTLQPNLPTHPTIHQCANIIGEGLAPHEAFDLVVSMQVEVSAGGLNWPKKDQELEHSTLFAWLRGQITCGVECLGGSLDIRDNLERSFLPYSSPISAIKDYVEGLHPASVAKQLVEITGGILDAGEMLVDGEGLMGLSSSSVSAVAHMVSGELRQLYIRTRNASLLLAYLIQNNVLGQDVMDYIQEFAFPRALHFLLWSCTLKILSSQRILPAALLDQDSDYTDTLMLCTPPNGTGSTQELILEAITRVHTAESPCTSLRMLPARVIALCGESFVDRSDIDSAMIPKYCITALERFLYVARQPRALLSLLGVLYSGAEEEESGMNDHPEWISEMRRARLELAGESYLAEGRAAGDRGDILTAGRLYNLSISLFVRSLPKMTPESNLVLRAPYIDEVEKRLFDCWKHAAEHSKDYINSTEIAELNKSSEALSHMPGPAQRLIRPLLLWPPLAPLFKRLLLSADSGNVIDELLHLTQSERWSESLIRLKRIEQILRNLVLIDRVAGVGFDPKASLKLVGLAINALPPIGDPARVLILSEEANLRSSEFRIAIRNLDFEMATHALSENPYIDRRKDNVAELVEKLCTRGELGMLCNMQECFMRNPNTNRITWSLITDIERVLQQRVTRTDIDVLLSDNGIESPNYFDCLYSFYVAQKMYRKACKAQYALHHRIHSMDINTLSLHTSKVQLAALRRAYDALLLAPENEHHILVENTQFEDSNVQIISVVDLHKEVLLVQARVTLTESRVTQNLSPRKIAILPIISVEKAISEYLDYGYIEAACDLVHSYWSKEDPQFSIHLMKIVSVLATVCCRLETDLDGARSRDATVTNYGSLGSLILPSTVYPKSVTKLTPNNWGLLQEILYRFDSQYTNFCLHAAVLNSILVMYPRVPVPRWLFQSFEGRRESIPLVPANPIPSNKPSTLFSHPHSHPSLLISILVQHGELVEACYSLMRVIDLLNISPESMISHKGEIFVPFEVIDMLFLACERALSGQNRGQDVLSGLEEAFCEVKNTLSHYLRTLRDTIPVALALTYTG